MQLFLLNLFNFMAALGKQVISNILSEELNKTTTKHVRGCFTGNRNYKIACRFYYHFTMIGLKYERCLSELNKEFDLSELRIAQLIMEGRDHLEKLKKEKEVKRYLQKQFPYFNWN